MNEKIKIGILGYGNVGKGVLEALKQAPDMELVGAFTRRDPEVMKQEAPDVPFVPVSKAPDYVGAIDVMVLCGGSATDLPEDGPKFAHLFNTVDSFDTHANIPAYFEQVDQAAKENQKVGVISIGWDPGLFSVNRLMAEAILPKGNTYTFWGGGVSQGHSDAIRRVEGVDLAVQYTLPVKESVRRVREGENPELTTSEKHTRACFVVAKPGFDTNKIEETIKTMPNYFDEYETTVTFIEKEAFLQEHSVMPHGGFVIRSGETGEAHHQLMEFSLKLDSNPEFTAAVLVAYARAAHRLHNEQQYGAKTILDIPLSYISQDSNEALRKRLL